MGDEAHPPKAPTTTRHLFTIRVLRPSELPANPSLPLREKDPQDTQPSLADFTSTCLSEALTFVDHTWPMLASKGTKSSPPATAPVHIFGQGFNNPHGGREHWFARRSTHEPKEESGTASWREFQKGIFEGHSVNEGDYTPEVFDARQVVDWGRVQVPQGEKWQDVSMQAYEMAHSMPFPLNNRVFPTLVIIAKYKPFSPHKSAFLVVQIPVELESAADALYFNEKNKTEGTTAEQKKSTILGRYVSVERCIEKEDGSVIWEMATASDAEGSVPMPLQKLGVPGAIVKDVGFFIGWVEKKRKGGW